VSPQTVSVSELAACSTATHQLRYLPSGFRVSFRTLTASAARSFVFNCDGSAVYPSRDERVCKRDHVSLLMSIGMDGGHCATGCGVVAWQRRPTGLMRRTVRLEGHCVM
jgi:hypothetical protein